jgi:2-keto-4-pentenoate hydratase/2-oxohepta-3-ene-1,7-dioic acid hydratase in catechol pathway
MLARSGSHLSRYIMYLMHTTRRDLLAAALVGSAASLAGQSSSAPVTRYVRFRRGNTVSYGILEGETIQPLQGDLFANPKPSGGKVKLNDAKLLFPCEPPKVLAVGLNYRSHIGNRTPPKRPEMFYKPVTSLQNPGDPIVLPSDAENAHYEGELVIIIGKHLQNVSVEQAREGIFGVTCGNDVSERDWQNGPDKDLQWWRAKGADTFGPMGPCIARGLDYGNIKLQTRLNGKTVQEQSTSDLLFDSPAIVSFISRYVTLTPGDAIYTGTPGTTSKLSSGDVVEVEIEGIGVLRNPVTRRS